MEEKSRSEWLRSKDASRAMKVSACTLAHIRDAGKLRFKKDGNAFLYHPDDVAEVARKRDKKAKR